MVKTYQRKKRKQRKVSALRAESSDSLYDVLSATDDSTEFVDG